MATREYAQEALLEKLGYAGSQRKETTEAAEIAPEIVEASFDSSQVHNLARDSLDFLAGLALPGIFKYFFPPVLLAAWNWLVSFVHKERDFSQLALGLPRGFGKTMLIKLICSLYHTIYQETIYSYNE